MFILDSNLIIYSYENKYSKLRTFIFDSIHKMYASEISKLEVLGYQQLKSSEAVYFQEFFNQVNIIPISTEIINQAIQLKQDKKMSLGDSIIASTAIIKNLELHTNNVSDFEHIRNLVIENPLN